MEVGLDMLQESLYNLNFQMESLLQNAPFISPESIKKYLFKEIRQNFLLVKQELLDKSQNAVRYHILH